MNLNIEGTQYKVSYPRFAHILVFSDSDISINRTHVHEFNQPPREQVLGIYVSPNHEFWKTPNMHRYYRYLNALFSMTLLLKGGNQVNVLMDSQTLLFFMQPNKTQCINVFDLIQQDIIYVLFYPSKGCIHAPLIMKTIEVVSQTYFEKETHLSPYTLYWIVPANLSRRLREPLLKLSGMITHLMSLHLCPLIHLYSSCITVASCPMGHGG